MQQYHRFYTNGERGFAYHTDAEIVTYLQTYPEDVAGWIDSMHRLALNFLAWGDMRDMRETYNHIVDVITALKKANGEDILE